MSVIISSPHTDDSPGGLRAGEEQAAGGIGGAMMAGTDNIAVEVQTAAAHIFLALCFCITGQQKAVIAVYNADCNGIVVGIRVRPNRADYGKIRIPKLIITSGCRVADGVTGISHRILKGCIRFGSVHIIRAEYCIDLRGVQHTDQSAQIVCVIVRGNQVVEFCDSLTLQIGNNERRVTAVTAVIEECMITGANKNRQSLPDIEVMDFKIVRAFYGIGCESGIIVTAV